MRFFPINTESAQRGKKCGIAEKRAVGGMRGMKNVQALKNKKNLFNE